MDRHAGKIVLNGATSQADRWLPALGDGYANVDDRSLSDLLAFSVGFGRLIRFYDLDDRPDGDWSGFFAADPTIVLACIAALRTERAERAFVELQRQALEARHFVQKFERLTLMFEAVVQLARLANDWLQGLGPQPQSPTARLLRAQLVAAIEASLGPHLRRLLAYAEGAGQYDALGQRIPLDLAGFLPIWRLTHDCPDASIYRGASRNRRIDHACPAIHMLFTQCLDTLDNLQARAHSEFDASLDSADHPPQTALYIAFAELFRTAQDTVNTVSSRFARFYYHDILREDFRRAQPDSTYLTFVLADDESVTTSSVPQQTLFAAGQDANGLDILFKADHSLLVTSAAIIRLRALRVISGPLLLSAHAAPRTSDVVQRVLGTEITTDPKATGAWPTFGDAEPGATDTTLTTPATIGFAIASPNLLLTGGDREIALQLYYSQDAAARLAALLAILAEATGLDDAEIWLTVLSQAFTLQVSTATGWLAIEQPYDVRLVESSAGSPGFELKFTLPAAAPAVEAYAPDTAAADGANPDQARPTVKALVNPSPVTVGVKPRIVEVYPLSLLCELDCTGWQIETHVAALTELQLSNTDGTIDPSKPFLPFGAPVVKGSYLAFWHRELFVKTLHSLQITITWFNLPPNDDGFDGWYCDYVLGLDGTPQPDLFDNTVFKADIDVVKPGTWQLKGGDALCLFRTLSADPKVPDCQDTEAAAPLCPSTCYDRLAITTRNAPAYYDPADSTVRIRLVAPDYAFGDDLYAANVLNAVINDLPPTTPPPDPLPFSYPNAPWLPQAASVGVDYVAIAGDADAGAGQFFHLMPFDGFDEVRAPVASLLPRFRDSGNLYIGLDGLGPSQPLTLLFQMTTAGGSGPLPSVQWQYLRDNCWIALSPEQVLGDGTNGLQNSGILSLALPAITDDNTVLGSGQWLGACVPRGAARFPLTSHITPHAMLATWVDNGSIAHLDQPLPAHSITASVQDLPDIGSIDQPMPSFGGRPPESGRSFQTWIGERLRHKDRGILGWDYERLVLEDFPTIWKVQALPARSLAHGDSPGDVLVVVVPGPNGYEAMDPTAPMASADLLARIHAMLASRTSPFIRLRVSNPVYVRITVSACVQFADNDGASIDRLNADLVQYLSPWFDDAARAALAGDYASEDEISEFIQTRLYVEALMSIRFDYAPDPRQLDLYFLTSALQHVITIAPTATPIDHAYEHALPNGGRHAV